MTEISSKEFVLALKHKHWFPMHYGALKLLGPSPAAMLHHLINKHKQYSGGDWFFNTVEDMENTIGYTYKSQKGAIEYLKKAGMLQTKQKGVPSKRYFHLNYDKIAVLFIEDSDGNSTKGDITKRADLDIAKRADLTSNNKAKNKEVSSNKNRTHRTVSKKAKRPARVKPFSFDKFDHEAAGRLLIILENNNSDLTVFPGRVRLPTLAKNITRLRIDRNVSKRDIGEMIKWLQNNYSNRYVPKMRKADDLFTHWEKFKNAMCRSVDTCADGTIPDEAKQMSEHKRKLRLVDRAELWIEAEGRDRFHPAELRNALEAMGEKLDAITPLFFISYGREE